jgi:uncharacterized membrane protein
MREWLSSVSELVITCLDALALLVIVVGTIEVSLKVGRAAISPLGEQEARKQWLRYARWLVAALTFQLAADIIETSVTTSWQTIGRLGAVALIRTFLNYFLERDVQEQCDHQSNTAASNPPLVRGRAGDEA